MESFLENNLILDDDFINAFEKIENTSDHFFITGHAGTGKSTLMNYFRKKTRKKVLVLAPTGLAAIQVGGVTIHSFFGFPLRSMLPDDPDIRKWSKSFAKLKILENADTIIIDEVSMLRADLLDAIDYSLRLHLNSTVPFGGKQLLLVGDLYQLPPVVTEAEKIFLRDFHYESPYFFSAKVLGSNILRFIPLKKIYRQTDQYFISILNNIRIGELSEQLMKEMNDQCCRAVSDEEYKISLCSTNASAETINMVKLRNLTTPLVEFKGEIKGNFNEKILPVDVFLRLKEGAQVMMVKNDQEGRWVNGTLGVITALDHASVKVKFKNNKVFEIHQATWENKTYKWDHVNKTITSEILGEYTQYPLKLAWAITIHKSQGLTFDQVHIDFGRGAFAHGQAYVALSRCRKLEGITLSRALFRSDIKIDPLINVFSEKIKGYFLH